MIFIDFTLVMLAGGMIYVTGCMGSEVIRTIDRNENTPKLKFIKAAVTTVFAGAIMAGIIFVTIKAIGFFNN